LFLLLEQAMAAALPAVATRRQVPVPLESCRHCRQGRSLPRRNHLCETCYRNLFIRLLYGAYQPKRGNRQQSRGLSRPPDEPTDALPGTEAKLLVMAERRILRRALFHRRDAEIPD
jgi:hypothetical protein